MIILYEKTAITLTVYCRHLINVGSVHGQVDGPKLQQLQARGAEVANRLLARIDDGLDVEALKHKVISNELHKVKLLLLLLGDILR